MAEPQKRQCEVPHCTRRYAARGYCNSHYAAWKRGGPLNVLGPDPAPDTCLVDGCETVPRSRWLCGVHASQRDRGETLHLVPVRNYQVWTFNPAIGYVVARRNQRVVLQHRWVMEQHLGRALERHENVHHLNGDRTDNRLENLELWSTKQPHGQRIEDKVRWAREILALYGGINSTTEREGV